VKKPPVTDIVLNDLELLPGAAAACLIGSSGRNSRFTKVLSALRPDINLIRSFEIADPDWLSSANLLSSREFQDALQVTDFVLTTFCKSRQYLPLLEFLRGWKGSGFFVVNPNFYHPFVHLDEAAEAHAEKLGAARNVLACAEDRAVYDLAISVIRPSSNLKEAHLKLAELYGRMGRQYFDHINPSAIQTIIEGGVADGLVTMQLLGRFSGSTVYGFDPDSQFFQKSYHKQFLLESGRFHFAPMGLWEKSDRLPFAVKKASTSSVVDERSAAANDYIDTISVDEFVTCNNLRRVDFIKLDIEGSELHALRGAKHTIRNHRPQLAVCVYHQLEHYYEIPSMLSDCAPEYIFRIGHYSPFHVFSETVLYAIPKELYNDR